MFTSRHLKDLIILTSACQLLSLISNYLWLLWLLVSPSNFITTCSCSVSVIFLIYYSHNELGQKYVYSVSYFSSLYSVEFCYKHRTVSTKQQVFMAHRFNICKQSICKNYLHLIVSLAKLPFA
jgi:hypothetical protein